MYFACPVNTLKYQQSRTLTTKRDMRNVPLATVMQRFNEMLTSSPDLVRPEVEALWFYGMNHGVSLIRGVRDELEPLNEEELKFVFTYHSRLGFTARKAFSYLLATCTREARHCHSKPGMVPVHAPDLPDGYPPGAVADTRIAVDWLLAPHGQEDGIYGDLRNNPPSVTIGCFSRALSLVFRRGHWSSAYGGPKWADISDCLTRFVEGENSAEMMLDTVWTLQHNTASVFNKGIIFKEVTGSLAHILDVQRSGQIPEYVLNAHYNFAEEADLSSYMTWLLLTFPGEIGRYVDWFKVKALGAICDYDTAMAAQLKKHGPSPWMDFEAKQALAAAVAEKKAAEQHAKDWFQVMPGLEVKFKKIKRAA